MKYMNLSSIPVTATPVRQVFFFEKTRNSSPPREHGSKNRDLRIVLPLIVSCFSRTPGFLHLVIRSKNWSFEHLHVRSIQSWNEPFSKINSTTILVTLAENPRTNAEKARPKLFVPQTTTRFPPSRYPPTLFRSTHRYQGIHCHPGNA